MIALGLAAPRALDVDHAYDAGRHPFDAPVPPRLQQDGAPVVEEPLHERVHIRLKQRLTSGNLDDVAIECTHLAEYINQPELPFFLWLRGITGNVLLAVHRQHLGTKMRDAHREVALYHGTMPEASSAALAAQLLGKDTRPSEAAMRAERKILLQQALNTLDPMDREILALRHFEQLNTAESARVLGIHEAAAGNRYLRAMKRLKEILLAMPGGWGEV